MTTEPRRFARRLRGEQTSTEEMLWHQLRDRRLGGHKFRRQVPIDGYVVDFLCVYGRLIVEIDGRQHASQAEYDAGRDRVLESMGFQVLRVTNNEVRDRLPAVLERIAEALERGSLTPDG